MKDKLILKQKTEILTKKGNETFLSSYDEFAEIPDLVDMIFQKEKSDFLNNINCGTVILNSLNQIKNSQGFIVEIPSGLHKMIKEGKATFDSSTKSPGNFTPNIRIKGESGIKAQATIAEKTNPLAITQSLANLGMMAMVQSALAKLDDIQEDITDIKKGQLNDRISQVTGPFKNFARHYPNFHSEEEMRRMAHDVSTQMSIGLEGIRLQLADIHNNIKNAPKNFFQSILLGISRPFMHPNRKIEFKYKEFLGELYIFNFLTILYDIILYKDGSHNSISNIHKSYLTKFENILNEDFQKRMHFLTGRETVDIKNALEFHRSRSELKEYIPEKVMEIECKIEDFKH